MIKKIKIELGIDNITEVEILDGIEGKLLFDAPLDERGHDLYNINHGDDLQYLKISSYHDGNYIVTYEI